MATDRTAVTAYLPEELEEYLTQYCTSKGLIRTYKTGETKPVLGTAIVEILEQYFKGDLPDNVPSNVLEETVAKEVEKCLGKSMPPQWEGEIESIMQERLEKQYQQVNHTLNTIYERIEALEETRSRHSTVRNDIKKLWERLADLEESLEQFENLSTRNTPHPTHFEESLLSQNPSTVEDSMTLEPIEQNTPTSPDVVQPTPQPSPDTNEPTPPQPTPPIVPRKTRFDGVEGSEDNETIPDVYTYEQLEDLFSLKRTTLESAKSRIKKKGEWNGIIESKGYTLQFVSEGSEGVRIRVLKMPGE